MGKAHDVIESFSNMRSLAAALYRISLLGFRVTSFLLSDVRPIIFARLGCLDRGSAIGYRSMSRNLRTVYDT